MVKTKDRLPAPVLELQKQPEPAKAAPEHKPAVFRSTSLTASTFSNGASSRVGDAIALLSSPSKGTANARAQVAAAMQRSFGNARMGRMMASPAGTATSGTTAGSSAASGPDIAAEAGPSVGAMPGTGGGSALHPSVRRPIESSFGRSMGSVRVHSGQASAKAAEHLGARAFTHGPDIHLGRGESPTDLGLMAHEASHVVQQGYAPPPQSVGRGVENRRTPTVQPFTILGDSFEREANQAASAAQSGSKFEFREHTSEPAIQRLGVSDALDFFAKQANLIPGFRMLTIILGVNPINMSSVERSPANILRAMIEFIPGGGLITQALDNYGVFDKIAGWVQQQVDAVGLTGASIKKAIDDFLASLQWSDILNLDDVWERAKRNFTDPISRLFDLAKRLVTGIVGLIKDAILMPLAKLAEGTQGWDLLTAVLGKNPITGEPVPRNADTLIGGFMKLIGQEDIWNNLKKSNAVPRAWAWFQSALNELLGFVSQIPALFVEALKSLELADIVLLPNAFAKVGHVFGSFLSNFMTWAGNAVWNLLEIIFEVVAPAAIPYLKKLGAAFKKVLKDPMSFVGNLVKAAKLGFEQFASKFLDHLKASFIEWLTGSLPSVYIPKSLDLREIIKFVLSVLGLTWQNIRQKLVKVLGEPAVKALEVGFDLVVTLVTQGPAAAWEKIKEHLSNLKDMVIQGITQFLIEQVVKKAIAKLVSLFVPGGAFIQAIVSIYDTVMVFVAKLQKIIQVVTAFLDSFMAIANGALSGAANKVESTLAGILTLAVNFLAGFIGLGNVAEKVMNIINTKVRQPIDQALDKVVDWIVRVAKSFLGKGDSRSPGDGRDGGGDLTVTKPFSMGSASHELTVTMVDGRVRVLMASPSRQDLLNAIDGEIQTYQNLMVQTTGEEQNYCISVLNALRALRFNINEEENRARAGPRDQVLANLRKIADTIAPRIAAIAAQYHLTDFAYRTFNVKTHLDTIQAQVREQLEKHSGESTSVGDGHANSATAAEIALGWVHTSGMRHVEKTTTAWNVIGREIAALDQLSAMGIDVSHEPNYVAGKRSFADCEKALSRPMQYLTDKGLVAAFRADIQRQRAKAGII